MKRKTLAIALAVGLACAIGLVGCGSPQQQSKPMFEAKVSKVMTTGNYDGSTMLVINLDVKNNSTTSLPSSMVSMYATATLDGTKLSDSYLGSDNPNAVGYSESVGAESEGIAQLVYTIPSSEGVVELVISPDTTDYTGTAEVLNEKIDLAEVEQVGSESEYDVKVNGVTVTDDGEGADLIVLDMTFTNNSEEAASFGSAIQAELFQNDIALKSSYLPYNHPAYDSDLSSNSYTDIKKGASIDVQVVYQLNDIKNPVEFSCTDMWSYDKAVILDKTIEVAGASDSQKAA